MLTDIIKSNIKYQYLTLELSQKTIFSNIRTLGVKRKQVREYIDEFKVKRTNKNPNKGLTKLTSKSIRQTLEKRKTTLEGKITVCSKEYWTLEKRKALSLSMKTKGNSGGYRSGSGIGKKQWYIKFDGNRVFCDSSYEYRFLKVLDAAEVASVKVTNSTPEHHVSYRDSEGKVRKYYPDFYLPEYNVYVETKGYITESAILKHNAASRLHKMYLVSLRELVELEKSMEICDNGCQADSKSAPP